MEMSIKTVEGKTRNLKVDDTSDTIDLKIHGPTRRLVIRLGPDQDSNSNQEEFMRIFVWTIGGKVSILSVAETETIANLKAKIYAQGGPVVDQQRIIFQGKRLEDGRTLADYRIKTGSTIVMVWLQCGC